MVQSLAVPDGTELQFDKLVFNIQLDNEIFIVFINIISRLTFQWKDVSPDQLMDSKLRCVFEMPDNKVVKTTVSQTSKMNI